MNLLDLIDPDDLTGFARAALADLDENQFTLSRYFPAQETSDIIVRFGTGGGGLARSAKFRAYDTAAPIGVRESVERKTTEIPPISEKLFLTEYERYRLMNNADEAVAQVYNDTRTLIRSILARVEVARGRALQDGSLSFAENGLALTMNFGRDAGHSVTAAVTWATNTTDILGDLQSWIDTYTDTNGFGPGGILCGRTVLGYMLANNDMRDLAYRGVGSPTNLTVDQLSSILQPFGVPPITINDAKVAVDGVSTRIIDDDVLVFTPPGDGAAGATVWGTTLEAQENLNLTGSAAPGVVAFLERTTQTPIQYWTSAAARTIPVLGNPDLTFKADVVP